MSQTSRICSSRKPSWVAKPLNLLTGSDQTVNLNEQEPEASDQPQIVISPPGLLWDRAAGLNSSTNQTHISLFSPSQLWHLRSLCIWNICISLQVSQQEEEAVRADEDKPTHSVHLSDHCVQTQRMNYRKHYDFILNVPQIFPLNIPTLFSQQWDFNLSVSWQTQDSRSLCLSPPAADIHPAASSFTLHLQHLHNSNFSENC